MQLSSQNNNNVVFLNGSSSTSSSSTTVNGLNHGIESCDSLEEDEGNEEDVEELNGVKVNGDCRASLNDSEDGEHDDMVDETSFMDDMESGDTVEKSEQRKRDVTSSVNKNNKKSEPPRKEKKDGAIVRNERPKRVRVKVTSNQDCGEEGDDKNEGKRGERKRKKSEKMRDNDEDGDHVERKEKEKKQQKKQKSLSAKKGRQQEKSGKDTASNTTPNNKQPRRSKFVDDAEKEAHKATVRRKYLDEIKQKRLDEKNKRLEKAEAMKEQRKQKKEDERKQREAFESRMQELRASFLDENSHMSTDSNSNNGLLTLGSANSQDGDSCGLVGPGTPKSFTQSSSTPSLSAYNRGCSAANELGKGAQILPVAADALFEYRWPPGSGGEHYFLQEQVSEYLGMTSFRRKYPEVKRRNVGAQERDFLVEMRIVNEIQADLGLTAIPSSQILDIMSRDYYDKYEAYMNVVMDRKDKSIKQIATYNTASVEAHKMADFVGRAVRSAHEWNKSLNMEKKEQRKCFFDMQTFQIHYPVTGRGKMQVASPSKTAVGHYPVSLLAGQYTDHFDVYSSQQLSHFPLNTATKHILYRASGGKYDEEQWRMMRESDSMLNNSLEDDEDEKQSLSDEIESDFGGGNNPSQMLNLDKEKIPTQTESIIHDIKKSCEEPSKTLGNIKDQGMTPKKEKENETKQYDNEIEDNPSLLICKICNVGVSQMGDGAANSPFRRTPYTSKTQILRLRCVKCRHHFHGPCAISETQQSPELIKYIMTMKEQNNWECSDCKVCSHCHDAGDEQKILFCDLCDRGFHNYCVGLDTIPRGKWYCFKCTYCISCGVREYNEQEVAPVVSKATSSRKGSGSAVTSTIPSPMVKTQTGKWSVEYKMCGDVKVYSHSFCGPCHRSFKRGQYCTECQVIFGMEEIGAKHRIETNEMTAETDNNKFGRNDTTLSTMTLYSVPGPVNPNPKFVFCMICKRQHHAACVKSSIFICGGCQKKTLDRYVVRPVTFTGNSINTIKSTASASSSSVVVKDNNAIVNIVNPNQSGSASTNPSSATNSSAMTVAVKENRQNRKEAVTANVVPAARSLSPGSNGYITCVDNIFKCQLCSRSYKNRNTLYSHMNRDHKMRAAEMGLPPKSTVGSPPPSYITSGVNVLPSTPETGGNGEGQEESEFALPISTDVDVMN